MQRIITLSIVLLLTIAVATSQAHEAAEVLVKSSQSWDGSVLPKYPAVQPQVTILKVTVPPKSKLPWHKHLVINAGYMISGELTVISESGAEKKLKPGDTLVELVGKLHYGRNDGDTPAVIVVFYAGAKGLELTALEEPPASKVPAQEE